MSITIAILDAVIEQLKLSHAQELAIEYFPEQPAAYRLNHVVGAVLVGYSRSQFGRDESLDLTWMSRQMTIPLTLIFKQLHGKSGVIAWLDKIRLTLTGWTPPHCDSPLKPISEDFLAHHTGLWQYTLDFTTQTNQIQGY